MLPALFSGDSDRPPIAVLALADGTVFRGLSIGADGFAAARITFDTSMSGHQEILSDPAHAGQIVAFTYPHIGNTGVNDQDMESAAVQVAGLVVRDCPERMSNFRARATLPDYLRQQGVVAISGVDTRKLTRILREQGSQAACILVGDDVQDAIARARSLAEADRPAALVQRQVGTPSSWSEGTLFLTAADASADAAPQQRHVVVLDLGVKHGVLRRLVDRGCRVTVVPADTQYAAVQELRPDGVVVAGGPGDPAACADAIALCRQLLDDRVPLFGIALGMQVMALALGAQVEPMATGHHGSNHPVRKRVGGQVFITTQNHDYAVVASSLPAHARVSYTSLFDGSVQGFALADTPAFAFQGQPEASPGPRDLVHLFDEFIHLLADQH